MEMSYGYGLAKEGVELDTRRFETQKKDFISFLDSLHLSGPAVSYTEQISNVHTIAALPAVHTVSGDVTLRERCLSAGAGSERHLELLLRRAQSSRDLLMGSLVSDGQGTELQTPTGTVTRPDQLAYLIVLTNTVLVSAGLATYTYTDGLRD